MKEQQCAETEKRSNARLRYFLAGLAILLRWPPLVRMISGAYSYCSTAYGFLACDALPRRRHRNRKRRNPQLQASIEEEISAHKMKGFGQ
jgi:hypothetical protein